MRESKITEIIAKAQRVAEALELLVAALPERNLKGRHLERSKEISGRDSSIFEVETRIRITLDIVDSFRESTRATWVPLAYLARCENALEALETVLTALAEPLSDIQAIHGGFRSFDFGTWEAHTGNSDSYQLINGALLVFDTTEDALRAVLDCFFILKPKAAASFQSSAQRLTEITANTEKRLSTLSDEIKQASDLRNEIAGRAETAKSEFREIVRLKESSDNDRKTIADHLAQATTERAAIEAAIEAADQLMASVKSYQSDFIQFQASLDTRTNLAENGAKELTNLIEQFRSNREKVDSVISQSELMLSSATVAGLAANFAQMTDKLTVELKWARIAFYIGILFLALSAVPLLAFVLMPIAVPILNWLAPGLDLPTGESVAQMPSPWHYLGQVLARISILLPAAWLVSFAGVRHSSLFRLREHYAYKYSMAVAVEGFKQQAPEYSNEIAALVLEQLAFNPADKLHSIKDHAEGKAPGLAGFLLDKIRARLEATSPTKTK